MYHQFNQECPIIEHSKHTKHPTYSSAHSTSSDKNMKQEQPTQQ